MLGSGRASVLTVVVASSKLIVDLPQVDKGLRCWLHLPCWVCGLACVPLLEDPREAVPTPWGVIHFLCLLRIVHRFVL